MVVNSADGLTIS